MNSFNQKLKFNSVRYVTELSFRPDHDNLPDHNSVSKQRLDSLVLKQFQFNPKLDKDYNDIVNDRKIMKLMVMTLQRKFLIRLVWNCQLPFIVEIDFSDFENFR